MLQIMSDSDIPPMPEEEMEMELEQTHGHPLAGNPAERIVALTKRIAYLEDQLKRAMGIDATPGEDDLVKNAVITRTKADLTEAKRQLTEWQTQHEGRN
jgi:hypothetical protein